MERYLTRARIGRLEALGQLNRSTSEVSAGLFKVYTGNSIATSVIAAAGFTPTTAGKILCLVDVQPNVSGLVYVNASFLVEASAADTATISMYYVDNVTSIVGGTAVPGVFPTDLIIGTPTSITPPLSTNPVVFGVGQPTASVGGSNLAVLQFPGIPVQLEVGVPCSIGFVAQSSNNAFTWVVNGAIAVTEQTPAVA